MYRERDPQAEAFDEALERLRNGKAGENDDPEMEELLHLAGRLDRELPGDLPDPAFRDRLKRQLLTGQYSLEAPTDIDEARWRRRLLASPWRAGAAAASVAVILILAVVLGLDSLTGTSEDDTDPSDQVAMPVDDDAVEEQPDEAPVPEGDAVEEAEEPPADSDSDMGILQADDGPDAPVESDQWQPANLPPFDGRHIVVAPLSATTLLAEASETDPEVEWANGIEMPDLPESAPVYYLSAPPDPMALMATMERTFEIDGTIIEGDSESSIPYELLNGDEEPILQWDPTAAYFQFNGAAAAIDVDLPGIDSDDVVERAHAWLEMIGFDLFSIEYATDTEAAGDATVVRLEPVDMPETGLGLKLGAELIITADGMIQEASGFLLSLVDVRDMPVRAPSEAWTMAREGDAFWPDVDHALDDPMVAIAEVKIIHLLTRLDEANYVLQPAVKFMGEADEAETSERARCYVPAVSSN